MNLWVSKRVKDTMNNYKKEKDMRTSWNSGKRCVVFFMMNELGWENGRNNWNGYHVRREQFFQ